MIKIRHPETIIIKNEFYPTGLKEEDIYNYYMTNKDKLLKQLSGREVMFFINVKLNEPIVKRKLDNNFIFVNRRNYDNLITGRTVSIHATMHKTENFGIVDIDTDNFNLAKKATMDVYDYLKSQSSSKVEIKFTGKSSFHIVRYTRRRQDINKTRMMLKQLLHQEFADEYLIGETRKSNKVNLDISSNKFRGGFIVPNSLSILGLKCMVVPRERLESFRRENAKIKPLAL